MEGLAQVYYDDYTNIGKHLDGRKPAFAFFDPPYNQNKDYGEVTDKRSAQAYEDLISKALSTALYLTQGRLVFLCSAKLLPQWLGILRTHTVRSYPKAELHAINVVKGAKGVRIHNLYNQYAPLVCSCRPHLPTPDVWTDLRMPGEGYYFREPRYDHPGITSLFLTERVIRHFTQPGDLVLDLFAGVGTTAVACIRNGRRCIGTEAHPAFVDKARERIEAATTEANASGATLLDFMQPAAA